VEATNNATVRKPTNPNNASNPVQAETGAETEPNVESTTIDQDVNACQDLLVMPEKNVLH